MAPWTSGCARLQWVLHLMRPGAKTGLSEARVRAAEQREMCEVRCDMPRVNETWTLTKFEAQQQRISCPACSAYYVSCSASAAVEHKICRHLLDGNAGAGMLRDCWRPGGRPYAPVQAQALPPPFPSRSINDPHRCTATSGGGCSGAHMGSQGAAGAARVGRLFRCMRRKARQGQRTDVRF